MRDEVKINMLLLQSWVGGRDAKRLLEHLIGSELSNDKFFQQVEESGLVAVYVNSNDSAVTTLGKGEFVDKCRVSGVISLDDESLFNKFTMIGEPDFVVDVGTGKSILIGQTGEGYSKQVVPSGGRSYFAKAYFKSNEIQQLADKITKAQSSGELSNNSHLESNQQRSFKTRLMLRQEKILCAIGSAGYDPKAIPPGQQGRSGVKAEIWNGLKGSSMFISKKVFDTAWQELRNSGQLKEASR